MGAHASDLGCCNQATNLHDPLLVASSASSSEATPFRRSWSNHAIQVNVQRSQSTGRSGKVVKLRSQVKSGSKGSQSSEQAGESVAWLNEAVKLLWPKANKAVQKLVHDEVTEQVVAALPGALKKHAHFKAFTLGDVTPVLGPVRVRSITTGGVKLEVGIDYKSDIDIELSLGIASVGFKAIHLSGTVIICFEPLLNEVPIVGGMMIYFLDAPTLDMDFKGVGKIADAPGIARIVKTVLQKIIQENLVLPHVIAVPIGTKEQGVDLAFLNRPAAKGVIKVTVLSAKGLRGADFHIVGKKTSDPFVKVAVGSSTWRSSTIKRTCDPVWTRDNTHDFVVYDRDQQIFVEVYDEDKVTKCDFLGRLEPFSMEEALASSEQPAHIFDPKSKTVAGTLTLRFEWLRIEKAATDPKDLLLEVKVGKVMLAPKLGKECALRARFGDRETTTSFAFHLHDGFAVEQALEEVAKRAHAKGYGRDVIAEITGLSNEDVSAVLKLPDDKKKSRQERQEEKRVKKEAASQPVDIDINYALDFPVLRGSAMRGALTLTLVNRKGKEIASTSMQVQLATLIGKPDGSSLGPVLLKTSGGATVEAELTLRVHGLTPGPLRGAMEVASISKTPSGMIKPVAKPDRGESVEWLNAFVKIIWPAVDKAVQKIVHEEVTEQINANLPAQLRGSAQFSTFTLGDQTPALGQVKVSPRVTGGIRLELGIDYQSDLDVTLSMGIAHVGVTAINIKGTVIVALEPLIEEIPVLGGLKVYFLDPPFVGLNLTGMGAILDVPGIADIVDSVIDSCVSSALVVPNVIPVPIGTEEQGVDPTWLKCPPAQGAIKVKVLSASKLIGSDWNFFCKPTSDPFVRITCGSLTWASRTVLATCDPVWKERNEYFFIVYDREQKLKIEVFDENLLKNDLIGVVEPVTIGKAVEMSEHPLNILDPNTGGSGAGTLKCKFEWYQFMSSGNHGTDACMLEVKVDKVSLPTKLGVECALRASLGAEEKTSPVAYYAEATAVGAAVCTALVDVTKRSHAKGYDTETISAITGLSRDEVVAIANGTDETDKIPLEDISLSDWSYFDIALQSVLYFPGVRAELGLQTLKLSVVDSKGRPLTDAFSNVPLSDVTAQDNKSLSHAMTLETSSGEAVSATVEIAVRGLKPGPVPVILAERD